jgi:hypothetical protein
MKNVEITVKDRDIFITQGTAHLREATARTIAAKVSDNSYTVHPNHIHIYKHEVSVNGN